jgi:hypothetical protein
MLGREGARCAKKATTRLYPRLAYNVRYLRSVGLGDGHPLAWMTMRRCAKPQFPRGRPT